MPTLSIRRAVVTDATLITQFIRALAEYEKLAEECVVTPEMIETQLFVDRPAAECLIGEIDGQPQGFAVFFTTFSTFEGTPGLYLEDLFVNPEARGKGLGKALLMHLVDLARERKYKRVEWAVLDWNTPSIEFYKKLGAKPMDEWTVFRLETSSLPTTRDSMIA